MKVRFKSKLTVREAMFDLETHDEMAEVISNIVEYWDLKDLRTGKDIPLPEPGTSEWRGQLDLEDWDDLVTRFIQWRIKVIERVYSVPNQNAEQSQTG